MPGEAGNHPTPSIYHLYDHLGWVGGLPDTILPGVPLRIADGRFCNAGSQVTLPWWQCFVGNARQVWRVWDTGERCGGGREILIVFLFFIFFRHWGKKKNNKKFEFLLFFYFIFFIFSSAEKHGKIKRKSIRTGKFLIGFLFLFFLPRRKK